MPLRTVLHGDSGMNGFFLIQPGVYYSKEASMSLFFLQGLFRPVVSGMNRMKGTSRADGLADGEMGENEPYCDRLRL